MESKSTNQMNVTIEDGNNLEIDSNTEIDNFEIDTIIEGSLSPKTQTMVVDATKIKLFKNRFGQDRFEVWYVDNENVQTKLVGIPVKASTTLGKKLIQSHPDEDLVKIYDYNDSKIIQRFICTPDKFEERDDGLYIFSNQVANSPLKVIPEKNFSLSNSQKIVHVDGEVAYIKDCTWFKAERKNVLATVELVGHSYHVTCKNEDVEIFQKHLIIVSINEENVTFLARKNRSRKLTLGSDMKHISTKFHKNKVLVYIGDTKTQ